MTIATATCEHITKEQIASEQDAVRLNVMRMVNQVTNNCATLIQKYQDFINGEYPDAKPYLIYSAMRDLSIMGGSLPEDTPGSPIHVIREEDAPKPQKPKITMKEIANWEMGRATREQTNNCLDLIEALRDMMNPRYVFPSADPDERKFQKATQIKPHHEFRALQELSMRGHGSQNPYAYAKTSAAEERRLQEWLSEKTREMDNEGIDLVTHMLHIIKNPKFNAWGEIITTPYTQSQRLWCIKHLLWRGVDIPWDHITHADIEQYYRDLTDKDRLETERLLAQRQEPTPLTPDQESRVRALLDETHRQAENADRRAAKKAQKKAKKAAKKADATKADAHDYNNAGNRNNANPNSEIPAIGNNAANGESAAIGNDADANGESSANGNNAAAIGKDSGNDNSAANNKNSENNTSANNNIGDTANSAHAPTHADFPTSDPGPTAVANALARHPQVDLDTALENHHSTAGIPKQNLTHEQIYDAITAEANFQKRQSIIQNRLRAKNPDAPEDGSDPKSRSP